MRVPLEWLREYVDIAVDPQQLSHDLTMSGTKIEAVHGGASAPAFEGVFVGRVLEAGRHPGADRLSLCRVEVGGEVFSIVCGASNVRAGLTVAVAKIGARLPGDLRIRKSKIRGETSEGMICSARELGLGTDSDGILELDSGLVSGTDFAAVIGGGTGGGSTVLEAEITPNRPDCLALVGVAREVAALYGGTLRMPPVWQARGKLEPALVPVEIESATDCGRYVGRALHGVRIGPSPDWMQKRLEQAGLHPINNVVDISNYVMLETGQPLHAFDLERLSGPRIVVRRARKGENLRTLDGVERRLDPSILVIADAKGAVALAGIMGGDATAVRDSTRALLLEAAYFDPAVVRAGRRKLGMHTDASYRFERQADLEAAGWAADRATQLFVELCGAEVRHHAADVAPGAAPRTQLALRVERCNRLVGTALDAEAITALLARLELPATPERDRVTVQVPSFRRDLRAEIDLVEEAARMHGYQNIAADVLRAVPPIIEANTHETFLKRLRDLSVALGYYEVRTSAFMEKQDPDRLGVPADDARRRAVRIANPIVPTLDTMRTSLLPGMLRVLRHNRNHEQEALRFAQVDRVYVDVPGPLAGLPTETEALVWVAAGDAVPHGWADKARAYDFYDLKGDLEALLGHLGVDTRWVYGYTEPFWNDAASFVLSGTYGAIGRGGAVREAVLRAFDLDGPAFALELDVAMLERHLPSTRRQRELPRFPPVKRDLSLVVPAGVTWAQVEAVATAAAGPHLASLQCFDVFTGAGAAGGERSLGLRLRFRAADRTLTDADVAPALESVVRHLADEYKVTLRAGA
jgi:phenylalanyl-tRNA synthetase beta chain